MAGGTSLHSGRRGRATSAHGAAGKHRAAHGRGAGAHRAPHRGAPPAVVEREAEIARLMAPRRTQPGRRIGGRRGCARTCSARWRCSGRRACTGLERITPADEIRNPLAIVASLDPAGAGRLCYDGWSERSRPATPADARLTGWAADRDGHPGRDRRDPEAGPALARRGLILEPLLRRGAQAVVRHGGDRRPVVASAGRRGPGAGRRRDPVAPPRRTSPIARRWQEIWDRLSATADKLAGAQPGAHHGPALRSRAPEFVADPETIRDRSIAPASGRACDRRARLRTLIAVRPRLRLPPAVAGPAPERRRPRADDRTSCYVPGPVNIDYLDLDEASGSALLIKRAQPMSGRCARRSPTTARRPCGELGTLEAAAEVVRLYGQRLLGAYAIVSKTATLSDVAGAAGAC